MARNRLDIIDAFETLGTELRHGIPETIVQRACEENRWFSPQSISLAVRALCEQMLRKELLLKWISAYDFTAVRFRRVGVIMAGNIPLVGFFDMLCVLVAGHECHIKPSSKDRVLMNYIMELLKKPLPSVPLSLLSDDMLPEAIIATGSDNSSIYFRSKYRNVPMLLRHSMHSIALLDGSESQEELALLAEDVFCHNGLGCRNVGALLIPRDFDIDRILNAFRNGEQYITESYRNNYRQTKAMCVLNGAEFHDGGFFLLRESESHVPQSLSTINCLRYANMAEAEGFVATHADEIQCIVSHLEYVGEVDCTDFGRAQFPALTDYPDRVDVLSFLLGLN